jgi:thiol-activated cytolysin
MKKSMMSMFAVLLLLLGVSMVWNSCRKDDDDDPIPITGDFDEYVKALPYAFGAYDAEPQTIAEGSESDVGYYCDTKEYEYSPGYSDVILLDPTTDVIAPGMFIKPGQSLTDGNYTAITNAKKPITLTRSTGEQITIDNPSLSSIRQGIKEMNQNAGTGAAQVDYLYQSIYSKEELKLSVGAHYKNPWAEISAGLDWDKEVEKNFMYAKFVQVFYTVEVDTDQKNNPSDWFEAPLPDHENWQESPVYVSSVKYGRIGIMTIQSEATETEMNAFMDAAIDVFSNEAEINLETEYSDFLSKTDFRVMVIGGNPSDAVEVVNGYDGFLTWIAESAEFSEDTPGSPVAYSLRYLKDNTPAAVVLSGSYIVKECYPLPEELYIKVGGESLLGPYYADRDPNLPGDGEISGNGPMQDAFAEILIRDDGDLQLNLYYYVQEWYGGPTGYPGDSQGDFYDEMNLVDDGMISNWPSGDWKVKEILSDTRSDTTNVYYDSGGYQTVTFGLDELVNAFYFRGDTGGTDLYVDTGNCTETSCTNMKVEFNPIRVIFERK